jgi:hypothetical protein
MDDLMAITGFAANVATLCLAAGTIFALVVKNLEKWSGVTISWLSSLLKKSLTYQIGMLQKKTLSHWVFPNTWGISLLKKTTELSTALLQGACSSQKNPLGYILYLKKALRHTWEVYDLLKKHVPITSRDLPDLYSYKMSPLGSCRMMVSQARQVFPLVPQLPSLEHCRP